MTDNIKPTVQEKTAWAKVPQEFSDWWNSDYSDESNPFRINSAAYWAWAGWSEAVRLNAQAAPAAPQPAQHPDDKAVDRFAEAMKQKLALAREKGRGGWETCSREELSRMLREHVEKGDPRDVANFCMFLWSLGHGITAQPPLTEKDALLRQALEALEAVYPYTDQLVDYSSTASEWPLNRLPANTWAAIEAIRNHLGVKND